MCTPDKGPLETIETFDEICICQPLGERGFINRGNPRHDEFDRNRIHGPESMNELHGTMMYEASMNFGGTCGDGIIQKCTERLR